MTEPTGACAPVAAACWGCNIPERARGKFPAPVLNDLTKDPLPASRGADFSSGKRKERFRCG